MKTNSTKRKVTETAVGAAIGAAIAGPVGAVAGGLVGHQVAAHAPPVLAKKRASKRSEKNTEDPVIHARLKRILVPLDFWPPSRRALRFVREWAGRFGSEVCLLHVIEPANGYGILAMDPVAASLPVFDYREPIKAELEKIAQKEFPARMKVSVHIRDGIPYDEIVTAAAELDVDLIVVGTHGRRGLSHALLGSTAERVVRLASCPVLTLRRAKRR